MDTFLILPFTPYISAVTYHWPEYVKKVNGPHARIWFLFVTFWRSTTNIPGSKLNLGSRLPPCQARWLRSMAKSPSRNWSETSCRSRSQIVAVYTHHYSTDNPLEPTSGSTTPQNFPLATGQVGSAL